MANHEKFTVEGKAGVEYLKYCCAYFKAIHQKYAQYNHSILTIYF